MDRRPKTLALLATALVAAGFLLVPATGSDDRTPMLTAEAVRRDVIVTVRAVGRLEAARSTVVTSGVRGDKGKILHLIEDGARVERGDVLVRLDPTPFEEQVTRLRAAVLESEALVAAQEQMHAWEQNQAEMQTNNARFDLQVAELDLVKLEQGEGPLELARLEGAAAKARQELEDKGAYVADLEALEQRGYAFPAEIAQIRAKIAEAQALHETADRQYRSYRDFVLPSLTEKARARVARARSDLEQTAKGVGFQVGKAAAALREARGKLAASRKLLEAAEAELESTVLRAPLPGMAVIQETFHGGQKRRLRVGDTVWQNQPLVYLPNLSDMIVKTQIREIDLHKIRVGRPADVEVDAYPGLRLSGVVESIGVLGESRAEVAGAEKYFQVVVAIREADPRLRPGMTARAVIGSAEVRSTLSVPVHAVFEEAGRHWVFAVAESGYEVQEVSLGVRNEELAQIVAGLAEGERVALSRPADRQIRGERRLEGPVR